MHQDTKMAEISDPDIPSFSIVDYVVFSLVLAVSIAIGLYHALTGGKQKTTQEIFVADRKMNSVPVGFSLLASWISAIALLGTPAECYSYGTMFWYICGSYIFMTLISAHLFIPTFYQLGITSVYQYLEMRFSVAVRLIGSIAFILYMVMYMAVVLYAPSLAISAVTGLNLWGAVLTVGLVCTLYTTLGGMKAVIWTDVFQTCVMFAGILAVIIHGSIKLNGFDNVWRINQQGGRIEFDVFSLDPTIRHTFWGLVIGGTFTWVGNYGCNQASVQRYLSCNSLKQAQLSLYVNMILLYFVLSLLMMCGLVIYAMYADCDPVSAGYISSPDQLMPFYVLKEIGFVMGLPGLFVAATFSGALSTVSSGLNALAAVTMEDVIRPVYKNVEEHKAAIMSRIIACVYGLFAIGFAYLASQLGPVLQVAISLLGLIGGPLTGLFSLGLFFPWANKWGAIGGSLCGFTVSLWIGFGAFVYPPIPTKLPLSTDDCPISNGSITQSYSIETATPFIIGTSTESTVPEPYPKIAELYSLSYMWYSLVGIIVVIVFGLIFSFLTGATNPRNLDPRLVCPVVAKIFCCCPGRCRSVKYCGVQHDRSLAEKNSDPYGKVPMSENGTMAADDTFL